MTPPHNPLHASIPPAAPQRSLLLARGLTAAGDQAWEMALPLAIAALYPGQLQLVAGLWLVLRMAQAVGVQRLAAVIDRWPALRVLQVGVFGQTVGVAATWLSLAALTTVQASGGDERWLWPILAVSQTTTSLCAALMDVAVAQDWVPRLIPATALSQTNIRLRQLDLGAEVLMPVVAGLVLDAAGQPLAGLGVIALLNFVSFLPEYQLLRPLLRAHPGPTGPHASAGFDLRARWQLWRAQPVFGAMAAYALLWSTILTPHGAVLTAWLRGVGQLGDAEIGLFRGLGAAGGVLGAQLHHWLRQRWPLVTTTRRFVVFQACVLLLATASLHQGVLMGFLAGVIASRIGLFGFAVGEVEIRQRGVPDGVRGRVSGLSGSVNQAATLFVLALAAGLPGRDQLLPLAAVSSLSVVLGAVVFGRWARTPAAMELQAQTSPAGGTLR